MQEVTVKWEEKFLPDKEKREFLNPRFIFLPVKENFKIKVKDGSYVYKNDIVAIDEEGHSLRSSISGKVLGLKAMDYSSAKNVSSIVIENDFKENVRTKKSSRKYINEYTRKDFLELLEDFPYEYKGSFLLGKVKERREILLINGVELDSLFANKRTILENMEDILEAIDFLGNVVEAKEILFTLKNTDTSLIGRLTALIGTYPNIQVKLVNDAYPNGLNDIQKKILKLPDDALVLDVEEVACVYKILKRTAPITQKFITITGDAVTPKCVIEVKLGTLLSEVLINNFDLLERSIDVYINGPLYGEKADNFKLVIDSNIDGVFITKKENTAVHPCINCGQCSKMCPVGLDPKYVLDHEESVENEIFEKCLQCGLCNYVCPVNIDLKSKMKRVKRE